MNVKTYKTVLTQLGQYVRVLWFKGQYSLMTERSIHVCCLSLNQKYMGVFLNKMIK